MDKAAELRNLHQMKASGALSNDEFESEKNRILNADDSSAVTAPPPSGPSTYGHGGVPLPPPPQSGGNGFGIAMIIVGALAVLAVIAIVVAAVMYVWAASFVEQGESAPIATFFVEETSGGYWNIDVIKVSKEEDLSGFSYFLKDEIDSIHVGGNGFGEVAMQIIDGEEYGIDTTYCSVSLEDCNDQLQNRADNVSADDGSRYPVHFIDGDRDGRLSAGDTFEVYGQGNSANGPAEEGWKLDIQFDASGDIVGSAKLV